MLKLGSIDFRYICHKGRPRNDFTATVDRGPRNPLHAEPIKAPQPKCSGVMNLAGKRFKRRCFKPLFPKIKLKKKGRISGLF